MRCALAVTLGKPRSTVLLEYIALAPAVYAVSAPFVEFFSPAAVMFAAPAHVTPAPVGEYMVSLRSLGA